MNKKLELEIGYHKNQEKIFSGSNARYKVIAKGRRFGLTRGMAHYVIENMFDKVTPILWVDTVYANIERYVERYFLPVLKNLPRNIWKYRANRNDLKINNSVCDFRSADKPENIEGFGYALIILNEAGIILKNRRLWEESIRPMIMDYKAKVIIGGTPKGKRVRRTNETHLFYELWQRGLQPPLVPPLVKGEYPEWESFNFSSYDNPMIDRNEIDELVKEISLSLRDQEVFGLFVDEKEIGIINNDWWQYFDESLVYQQRVLRKTQSWDTAYKKNEENDYSVCTTWIEGLSGFYLIDLWKGRLEFPELKKKASELYELNKPNEVLIEDKASGQSLIQELQRETKIPIKPIKIENDKIARVHAITPLIEAGKVYLPLNKYWVKDFTNECEDFPNGEFDDIVDSMSQYLNYAKKDKPGNVGSIVHIPRKNLNLKRIRKIKRFRRFGGR